MKQDLWGVGEDFLGGYQFGFARNGGACGHRWQLHFVTICRWKILEGVRWYDGAIIKGGGEPQVVGVVGNAGQRNELAMNQCKITM